MRMARAFEKAFRSGMERVILVGTDIPGLDENLIHNALEALQKDDLVLGPANDGGYYLIGLRRPLGQLFQDIPWGTGEVLAKTLQAAGQLKIRFSLLRALDDVDRPEDMPIWENRRKETPPLISIIIPALNEEKNITQCLMCTQNASGVERIVVDGGSRDRTREIARSLGAKVIASPAGRGKQMNSGAQAAAGDLLLFLHADTLLPPGFADTVRYTIALPGVVAGAFEFRLDAASPLLRIIERGANWRSRHLQLPYGDQAIFTRSGLFREMGGFREMPIMEDFEFVRRLKKRGRVHTVPFPALTSARRWKELGTLRTTLINEAIVAAYYLGVSPARIRRFARRASMSCTNLLDLASSFL
jgi:hypothetical protein